jgi:hypothetical protein
LHRRRQTRRAPQLAARAAGLDLGIELTEEPLRIRSGIEVAELGRRGADAAPDGELARGDAGVEPEARVTR